MISRIKKGLRKYDQFGVCLNFNIQNKQQYQSVFGGIMSTAMTIILLYIFIIGLVNIFLRNQFQVDVQQQQNMNPQYSEINITNFFFAIKLDDPFSNSYSYTNKTAYEIVMNQVSIETFSNGTSIKKIDYQYSFVKCEAEHLKYINNQGQDQIKNNIGNYLCLPLNYSLKLQGTYNSEMFYFPALKISICQESYCYSQDEILEIAKNSSFMVSLSTLIQSSIFIKDSQDSSTIQTLNSDFFLQTNLLEERKADLFLRNNRVHINNNLLSFYQEQDSKNYWSFSIFNVREFLEYHQSPQTIFSVNLRISQEYEETKKIVNTFDDFLSYFGGLLKVISSIFGIIALKYNQLGLRISLANHLYQFNIPKKQDGQYKFSYDSLLIFIEAQVNRVTELQNKLKNHTKSILKATKYMKAWASQKMSISQQQIQQSSPIDLANDQQIDQFQYEKYVEQLQEYKQGFLQKLVNQISEIKCDLKLGFNFIIYELICCSCCERVQQTRKILKQCDKLIQKDLDIINLLQKIQEIEKLKRILLEEDQIIVFNYSPKPVVYVLPSEVEDQDKQNDKHRLISKFKEIQKKQATLRQQKPFTKPKKLFEIYQSYHILKEQKSQQNKKIIGLLGPTIELIFQKYYELQKMAEQFDLPIISAKTFHSVKSENIKTQRVSTLFLFSQQHSILQKIEPKSINDNGSDVEA